MTGRDQPCAFCAIVAGEAPAHEVLRTERFVAFLDVKPLFHGHVLVVPTTHVVTFDELPAPYAAELAVTTQQVQRAVERATGADGSLLIVNNVVSQSVPHLHQHVIPRRRRDGLRFWLGPRHPYEGAEHAAGVAAGIREALAADLS
ncbi:HIT family protein [Actinomarinicola tropica]|uniref:HIT domain-containing protein n=1 Tax=Actinomarinicola tropica TaxID=2789776 RepID=A0A5Q2RKF3_9ACTN|nr:HIT family protein [Actinomarinicola tropica]QGG95402.1 HIT domain-containing protein [Actinomarinicola tropica]